MTSKSSFPVRTVFGVFLSLPLFASFPEPDVIVYGKIGPIEPSTVVATWQGAIGGSERAVRIATANGCFYLIRIKVDDKTSKVGENRSNVANLGDKVTVSVGGQEKFTFEVARGLIKKEP